MYIRNKCNVHTHKCNVESCLWKTWGWSFVEENERIMKEVVTVLLKKNFDLKI